MQACSAFVRQCVILVALVMALAPTQSPAQSPIQSSDSNAALVKNKHIGVQREAATKQPRSESDQAVVDGWPLYRTDRGQAAFNDAMAALKATDTAAPTPPAFKGCTALECNLSLPALRPDGWMPAGRLWVSPTEYVLIAHSPRNRDGQTYRRRMTRDMRVFVFHEFHNSSRNTDLFDTVSSHKGAVFVPLYLGKTATDAYGRRFVIVLQVAPLDVASIHASNHGSAGPGMEVARNISDAVDPLQNLAGILVATIAKVSLPRMQVVNHRGTEGQPMLNAYERRLATLRSRPTAPLVVLPFTPAPAQRLVTAAAKLDDLILRRGASPRLPVAERGVVPSAKSSLAQASMAAGPRLLPSIPQLIGPIRLAVRPAAQPASATKN